MAKKGKQGSAGPRSAQRIDPLTLIGGVLYVVAWFVPVARGQEFFGGVLALAGKAGTSPQTLTAELGGPDWLPGWVACKFAWNMLVGPSDAQVGSSWRQHLAGSSCLINVVMAVVLIAVALGVRSRLQGTALLVCAGVGASWAYLLDKNPFEVWGAGYWLWLGSFVLVGLGLLLPPRRA